MKNEEPASSLIASLPNCSCPILFRLRSGFSCSAVAEMRRGAETWKKKFTAKKKITADGAEHGDLERLFWCGPRWALMLMMIFIFFFYKLRRRRRTSRQLERRTNSKCRWSLFYVIRRGGKWKWYTTNCWRSLMHFFATQVDQGPLGLSLRRVVPVQPAVAEMRRGTFIERSLETEQIMMIMIFLESRLFWCGPCWALNLMPITLIYNQRKTMKKLAGT